MPIELIQAYDEYCVDCAYEGTAPKPFYQWLNEGD